METRDLLTLNHRHSLFPFLVFLSTLTPTLVVSFLLLLLLLLLLIVESDAFRAPERSSVVVFFFPSSVRFGSVRDVVAVPVGYLLLLLLRMRRRRGGSCREVDGAVRRRRRGGRLGASKIESCRCTQHHSSKVAHSLKRRWSGV
ncbi:hypothetical protein BDY24DRAFT_76478 [Mrakia frigida]|uniref:uncharacterized protein n=1 Tax=Mrakia frigida TaxID=29902 RepID=UPI003FCBF5C6